MVSNSINKSIDVVEDLIDHKIVGEKERRSMKAYMYAYEESSGRYHVIIFVRKGVPPGTLAHEAKHALNIIFQWHGVRISTGNDENECYYLDWLITRIYSVIKKYTQAKALV